MCMLSGSSPPPQLHLILLRLFISLSFHVHLKHYLLQGAFLDSFPAEFLSP